MLAYARRADRPIRAWRCSTARDVGWLTEQARRGKLIAMLAELHARPGWACRRSTSPAGPTPTGP